MVTAHSAALSSLAPGTRYHYRVRSRDAGGNLAVLGDYSFTTATSTTSSVRYLSDSTWTSMTNGWGDAERNRSNGELDPSDGGSITLSGVVYPKGLGVHAHSELRYAIPAECAQFVADIGVDDEVGPSGSVVFEVWGDSSMLFRSAVMTGESPTANVAVSLSGRTTLRLVVTNGGDDIDSDHADWAGARFVCGTTTSLPPPNSPPSVSVTRPSNGTSQPFRSGNAVTIEASATDTDGKVTAVYFYVNNVAIGTDTTGPYSFSWKPPSRGTFSISAVAVDNKGATTRSSPVTLTLR
jgi:hypothetical protein